MKRMNIDAFKNDTRKIKFIRKHLIEWGRSNFISFPWRCNQSDFHSLVAEILLQRTRAEQVVPVFKKFCEEFPDVSALARSSEKIIKEIIEPLGLHWRAKQLLALGIFLVNQKSGEIPDRFEELIKIPSVGPYAASAYLSLHRNIYSPIIDSNVVRFYGRVFGFNTDIETRRKKWFYEIAVLLTPKRQFRVYNYSLIDFTRAICKPRPYCEKCPVRGKCYHFQQNIE